MFYLVPGLGEDGGTYHGAAPDGSSLGTLARILVAVWGQMRHHGAGVDRPDGTEDEQPLAEDEGLKRPPLNPGRPQPA